MKLYLAKADGSMYCLSLWHEPRVALASPGDSDSGWVGGFALATVNSWPLLSAQAQAFIDEYSLDEYFRCAMYEGGEFCGILWNYEGETERLVFSWSLLPESRADVEHIEKVIVPYGRYTPKPKGGN